MLDPLARLSAVLLAGAFAWAGLAKALDPSGWSSALARYGLDERLRRVTIVGVPVVEVATSVVTLVVSARAGAALSTALLASFSLALLRARTAVGDRLPCGCFGKASERDYRLMIARNAALAGLAGLVLVSGLREGALAGYARPGAVEALPALLVVLGIALAAWIARATFGGWRKRELS